MKARIAIAVAVAALALSGCAASTEDHKDTGVSGDSSSAAPTKAAPVAQVRVKSCKVDKTLGMVIIKLTIHNTGKETASYIGTAELVNAKGDRLQESSFAANSIAAGQTAAADALPVERPKGKFTCKVAESTRVPE